MGMIHVYLLVMFLSVVSVRSCTLKPGGRGCRETFGGKWKGSFSPVNNKIVFVSLPTTQRKFQNKWASGIIVIRSGSRRTNCKADDNMVPCPRGEGRQWWCMALNKTANGNDCTTTGGTSTTGTPTDTVNVNCLTTTMENDYSTTSGTAMTDTVTLTSPSTHRPTVNAVTSMTQENDHGQTSRTPTIETVTQTSPSTCIVDGTILNTDITLRLDTGSRVRGSAYVMVQWKLNRAMCNPESLTLTVVPKGRCIKTGRRNETKTLEVTGMTETFIRGLQPYANYHITLTVTCEDIPGKHCESKRIRTEESVPTAPPNITTVKAARNKYLIFKWNDPPCDEINGNITNYDFIFVKNEDQVHNVVPHGRRFVVFNGMKSSDSYSFQVRANTNRGFGIYSKLKTGEFGDLILSSSPSDISRPT